MEEKKGRENRKTTEKKRRKVIKKGTKSKKKEKKKIERQEIRKENRSKRRRKEKGRKTRREKRPFPNASAREIQRERTASRGFFDSCVLTTSASLEGRVRLAAVIRDITPR